MNLARFVLGAVALAMTLGALAQGLPKRVILIPLDDRPASTQMPQMIGEVGGIEVVLPPKQLLGRFDKPGSPEALLDWLSSSSGMKQSDAVIVSLDMATCGGLIASRTSATPYELARRRLFRLWQIRQEALDVPFYVYSSLVRLAPTATKETAQWRHLIAKWAELKEQVKRTPTAANKRHLAQLEDRIPQWELDRYLTARRRMVRLSGDLMQIMGLGGFTLASFGQDDAVPVGIHLSEIDEIKKQAAAYSVSEKVTFLQGIDQVSSVLLARAAVDKTKADLAFSTSYSGLAAARRPAAYEAVAVEFSLRQQFRTAGARLDPASSMRLMVNTDASESEMSAFRQLLVNRTNQGLPTAVADVNLGKNGTGDPRLIETLMGADTLPRLNGYAGWNTAANTMGTVIPMAMIHELAKKESSPAFLLQARLKRILFHRLVSDWLYHRYTRPIAYQFIDSLPNAAREELTPAQLAQVTQVVKDDLAKRTYEAFNKTLEGEILEREGGPAQLRSIENLQITLPWPRAYEVEVDFTLGWTEVTR